LNNQARCEWQEHASELFDEVSLDENLQIFVKSVPGKTITLEMMNRNGVGTVKGYESG